MLSVLILTMPGRRNFLSRLLDELDAQKYECNLFDEIEIKVIEAVQGDYNIGKKRNLILQNAKGKYVCFIDDDDRISKDYLPTIITALKENPNCDCLSLKGIITTDGKNPEIFEHSIKYSGWKTTGNVIKYERYPNHLNVIRAEIAKQFKFPEINMGEDHVWSTVLYQSGLLKNEIYIDEILYYYQYRTNK